MISSLQRCQPPLGSLPAKQAQPAKIRTRQPRSRPLRASVAAMSAKDAMHGHYVASLGEALYGRAFAARRGGGGGAAASARCMTPSPW